MGAKAGFEGYLYYNSATWATPTWVAIDVVRDVTANSEKGEVTVTSRGDNGIQRTIAGIREDGFEFECIKKTDDAAWQYLKDAYFNGTNVELLALEGPVGTSGNEGLRAECVVLSFGDGQGFEDAQTTSVSAKPTDTTNDPEWFTAP